MKKNLQTNIGNFAVSLGKYAVGKCMIPGMYDPKIPQKLHDEMKNKRANLKSNTV